MQCQHQSRCDLLIRGESTIILELKVRKSAVSDIAQLLRYMDGFKKETGISVSGAVVYFLPQSVTVVWDTD